MLQARERYSGGRIVAGMAMTLAGLGTVNVFLQVHELGQDEPEGLLYLAGALAGLLAGWKHLGKRLGRGMAYASLMGAGAALLGAFYAMLAIAARSMLQVYQFSKFDTVMELLNFLLLRFMEFFWLFLQPQPVTALIVGGLVAGVFAEHYRRVWN